MTEYTPEPPMYRISQIENNSTHKTLEGNPENPTLIMIFRFVTGDSRIIRTQGYASAWEANKNLCDMMSYPNAALGVQFEEDGAKRTVIINLNEVAYITIDQVPSSEETPAE